jgi:hypothetical protein
MSRNLMEAIPKIFAEILMVGIFGRANFASPQSPDNCSKPVGRLNILIY